MLVRARLDIPGTDATTRAALRHQLVALVDPALDRSLATTPRTDDEGAERPAVVLVVGVNGTGKTTTTTGGRHQAAERSSLVAEARRATPG